MTEINVPKPMQFFDTFDRQTDLSVPEEALMRAGACEPVGMATPRSLKKVGMAITHLDGEIQDVFRAISDPSCRFVLLRPVSSAYESWRGAATLAPKFRGRIKAWPVEAVLRPGVSLGPEQGLNRWDAERAVAGLLNGDPIYVELAAQILETNAGCSLDLPGDATALLVAERDFPVAVHVGEPVHLSGSLLD